ncbi:MAG: DUF1015 domain-containing protein [Acidobacteria bacterium]|nr:DUF1015 domain-containing protein [Acidobacteriota bacterium]
MANIFPFQAYRYSPKAGDLNHLVTQPYDKISPRMQARYLSLSPYNLVRIILGERRPDDTDANNTYTRAAAHFREWIEQGILEKDDRPGFYVYFQEFEIPDSGEKLVRKGFVGLGAVEEYSAGVVHRHEQTLSGPKKDRQMLLEHTRAHCGQLFMLYPDREGAVDRILDEIASSRQPVAQVKDEYGAVHRLYSITDPARLEQMRLIMSDKKLLIADGHHRYETALAFKNQRPVLEDARAVMMTFVNMYSPGLRILATHRLVSGIPNFDFEAFLRSAEESFAVHRLDSPAALKQLWEQLNSQSIRIGAAVSNRNDVWLLTRLRRRDLDVKVLHEELIEKALGISAEAVREEKHIGYVRGLDAAFQAVRKGEAQLAFLLEPTTIDQVAGTSFSGGVMPQKSTDFYPKLLSGLTIYRLER